MRYSGIISNDSVDIDHGIAVSFWVQGCPHHCEGCHNPQTWDFSKGYELPKDYIEKILKLINKNNIYRDLSILGGEPLCKENINIVLSLAKKYKKEFPKHRLFIWTGGIFEDLKKDLDVLEILKLTDILVDGEFQLAHRDISLPLRGSPNQRIIDVQKSLKENKIVLYKVVK